MPRTGEAARKQSEVIVMDWNRLIKTGSRVEAAIATSNPSLEAIVFTVAKD
ncbi:hypothetical protein [Trichocoleus sp. FACHB-591]|uniref:hypothetical protein n=1 Tax=Trichocoleus sp. FACHB-591 TaxID=2692872 RepID=UPI001A7ED7E7|nr:hypothetical protein [Trichocoleus sp. FACHB-591]